MDSTEPLPPEGIKRIQQVVGTLLYYARVIDNTLLVALNAIAAKQSNRTQQTADDVTKLLNYCTSNPDAVIKYRASDMALHIISDASFMSELGAKSRAGGIYFLGENPTFSNSTSNSKSPKNPKEMIAPALNVPVHVEYAMIKI